MWLTDKEVFQLIYAVQRIQNYYLLSLATGISFKRQKISETELFSSRYKCSKQLVYQINIRNANNNNNNNNNDNKKKHFSLFLLMIFSLEVFTYYFGQHLSRKLNPLSENNH